jgi:general secretion pathway protein K
MSIRAVAKNRRGERSGSALLTVLWLSAALAAIAFSLATTVRGETERTAAAKDGLSAQYLAAAAIERTLLYIEWAPMATDPEGKSKYFTWGTPALDLPFPTGVAHVEVIPEASKINVNTARPEELYTLLTALGAGPDQAREITLAIVDWRTPLQPGAGPTEFDSLYLSQNPSFQGRHASFEEIEELLLVRGMTPELFHGGYEHDANGRLRPRPALRDCVTVYGASALDANAAQPQVLTAVGLPPEYVNALVEARRQAPIRTAEQLKAILGDAPGASRIGIGGGSIFTLRATARLRRSNGTLSEDRRSAAAVVKMMQGTSDPWYHVLRWYDNVWVQ